MRKSIRLYICFILIFTFCLPTLSAKAEKEEDFTNTKRGELHGFYPSYLTFSDELKKYIDHLDSISFAFSKIDGSDAGSLNITKGKNGNYGFYYPNDYIKPIEYAKSQGKSIQLNVYMDGNDCVKFLPYQEEREAIIEAIVQFMKTDITSGRELYYDGVVIDFEGLRDTDSNKKPILYKGKPMSIYYTQFLKELKRELDTLDKKLYAAVNPALYYDGYDFKDILDLADRVIIMAHDYEPAERLKKSQVKQYTDYNSLKPIHSLAPIQMVRRALNEIQEAAGNKKLSKVWLQINLDAAQWQFDVKNAKGWTELPETALSRGGRLSPLYKSIKARVDNADGYGKNISYGYNKELQSPYIQYYNSSDQSWNVIIYEDGTSIRSKIELAKAYNLGGISLWSLYNIPDYNDVAGKKIGLNGWSAILSSMNSYGTVSSDNRKYISFKDALVEQAVREKLGKVSGDISVGELKSIYRLKLPKGVKSLKDLKRLPNLEYLDAGGLNLKDITEIGNLTKLRVLYLQRNKISNLEPLKKLNQLEVLSLNGNNIKNINALSKLTKLEKLYIKDNKITSISALKKLTNLKELYLSGNKIDNYSPVKAVSRKKGFLSDFK